MADSDDEEILYDNDLGRNLIGGKRVKNVDDVLNGGKKDKRKLRKTLALCLAFLCLGLCLAILGPTLLSLQKHLDTTLPKISWVFAGRSVGYLFGAILGGMLFQSFNPLFLLSVVLFLCGIGVLAVPFVTSVLVLAVSISSVGISMGVLDTGANLLCLRMWGKKRSGTMLQALHFSFALGAFISPLVAAPFLAETTAANSTMLVLPSPMINVTLASPVISPVPGAPSENGTLNTGGAAKPITTEGVDKSNGTELTDQREKRDAVNEGTVKPSTTKGTVKPSTTKGTVKPSTTKGTVKPSTTKGTVKPSTTKGTVKPSTTKGTVKPSTTKGTVKPSTTKGTVKPSTTKGTVKPSTTKGTVKPSTTKGTVKPSTTKGTVKPSTTKGTVKPSTTKGTVKPSTTKGTVKPSTTKGTVKPSTTKGTVQPITIAGKDTPSKSEQPAPQREVERFAMPFIIIGILVLLTCGLFFYLLCTKPKEEPGYIGSEHSDGTSAKDNSPFRTRILILLFFFYFLYVGGEVAYGSFVPMFASKSQHHFEQDRASHVAALFWGAFCLGRGLAICLASVISPLKMVIADMVGCVTASLALTLFADSNENILWICSALLGLSMASLFPTGIVWLETYTPVTGNTASFLIVGSALGEMCVPVLIGYLFEDRIGPMVLMYWMLATSALSALIFVYVFWLMAESGREKKSLPAEKSPALELFQSVEEALPMEELFKNGGSNNKQMSKPRVPPILKRKNHKE
ncbi:sodium-dependent glucose transporter 1-like [Strongylocentrotus purpuratus]|uniref:Sodium-dependent glucose transporter 1 n=1 Tax=Strongylocentrotus purpuratus TaxID=7668 RepID=A0A7M7P161_STRPU|nr:sodium-dependent glucose transporter 1-like [Strongylocentrotus purpuratus]XP_030844332.1 sodium-dependent glucose transporter 1-like [Strongylocentrotus purpuratus]